MRARVERRLHVPTSESRSETQTRLPLAHSPSSSPSAPWRSVVRRWVKNHMGQGADAGTARWQFVQPSPAYNQRVDPAQQSMLAYCAHAEGWADARGLRSVAHRPNLHLCAGKTQIQLPSLRQRPPIIQEDFNGSPIGDPTQNDQPFYEKV